MPLQVLQWLFGAVAGHPMLREICDHIAFSNFRKLQTGDPHADTEERTGPGLWTDMVLEHAMQHPHRVSMPLIHLSTQALSKLDYLKSALFLSVLFGS